MGLLEGRIALVTGSTRGIGRAVAERFVAEGAIVVVNGRRQGDAEAAASEIGDGAIAMGGDMSDPVVVSIGIKAVIERLGRIDILVNNAGISIRRQFLMMDVAEWTKVLRVNLDGPMYVTKAVLPHMVARRQGVIVNVVSPAAFGGAEAYSSYAASKSGLMGLTATLAVELAGHNIRVNALSPLAMTDMILQNPPDFVEEISQVMPAMSAATGAAVFLASDLSFGLSGQVVHATQRFQEWCGE